MGRGTITLLKRLKELPEQYDTCGVLVIDEDEDALDHFTRNVSRAEGEAAAAIAKDWARVSEAQLQILSMAKQLKIPIYEVVQGGTRKSVRDITANYAQTFQKPNAFITNACEIAGFRAHFDTKTWRDGILLVMGYHTNACVAATIGANPDAQDASTLSQDMRERHDGLIQRGLHVVTGLTVLHPPKLDNATWGDVEKYERITVHER